ncbi:MAG TPA: hypothetical protein VNO55_27235, partial [Polyangia bacterium]|nr:hypothetical protein [Polyangia bacterium]
VGSNYATSDWEEEGERAYTIGRAIDFLGTVPNVRTDRIFMMGLSMGGEVTTITSALDPRIALAVVAGYSPDMNVMDANGNHRCYQWRYADIHEYLDVSDYESMIAPRPLVVETGLADNTFSQLPTPFAADKQVLRRARAAYGADSARLIHYLHYDGHNFHVGDVNPSNASRPRNVVQASVVAPTAAGDQSWQTDGSTTFRSLSLYALMDELLP